MTASKFMLFAAALVAACLPGCGNRDEDLMQVQAFLQKPRTPVSGVEYRVMPPDVLAISSLHVTEINNVSQQVRPDGKINVPLLGEVMVAGRTPAEIETLLQESASQYYKVPDAKVVVSQYQSQKYFVYGQVLRPGARIWTGRDTIIDAMAEAQPNEISWPEKIRVVRSRKPAVGGYMPEVPEKADPNDVTKNWTNAEELTIDLMAMVRTGDMSHNIMLQPNDIIYVPPNPFGALGLEIRKFLYPVQPIIETVQTPQTVRNSATYNNNTNNNTNNP